MILLHAVPLLGLLLAWMAVPSTAGVAETVQTEPESAASARSSLESELAAKGFALGAPAFIRVFKESSTLELWLWKNGRFYPFKSYAICKWSGELGPKLAEGDRQSPEGVYFISGRDLIINARWHRAMNLGFPNSRDKALGLTGSGILIHGKCSSIGCFSLTDPVVEDVYDIDRRRAGCRPAPDHGAGLSISADARKSCPPCGR